MARLVPLLTSLGNTSQFVEQVFEELAERYEIHYAWGWGATGDHNRGRALDVMSYSRGGGVNSPGPIRRGWNKEVVDYLLRHKDRLAIKYIIYDETIISRSPRSVTGVDPWQPKRYTGASHDNHVHISFLDDLPPYRSPQDGGQDGNTAKEWDELASKDEIQDAVRAVVQQELEQFGNGKLRLPSGARRSRDELAVDARSYSWATKPIREQTNAIVDILGRVVDSLDVAEADREAIRAEIKAVRAAVEALDAQEESENA